MTANEHTGVLGPMHGKGWKKGGGKEYNEDNEPTAEFVTTLDKLEPGQAGVILELNTGGGMRRRLRSARIPCARNRDGFAGKGCGGN